MRVLTQIPEVNEIIFKGTCRLMHLRAQLNPDCLAFQEDITVAYSDSHSCLAFSWLLLPEALLHLSVGVQVSYSSSFD